MLDDKNVISQRDPQGALRIAAEEYQQTQFEAVVRHPDNDGRTIENIVIAGMGGSALAALLIKDWLHGTLNLPFDVVRDYDLPAYVGQNTFVIVSSCSGNTEETLSCLDQARQRGSQVAITTSGGRLLELAENLGIAHVVLPDRSLIEPRMSTIAQMRAIVKLFSHFELLDEAYYDEIGHLSGVLEETTSQWLPDVTTDKNYAKQLALMAVGKTAMFYGGALTGALAYKWKISWNENSKNVAFWNQYPEFNHNEFMGWTSHPIEKPYAVFDLISNQEHSQTLKRFEVSDRLLSGSRPKATQIHLHGGSVLTQILWGTILADFASIYLAILNGVNPTPVDLIEKLKQEL